MRFRSVPVVLTVVALGASAYGCSGSSGESSAPSTTAAISTSAASDVSSGNFNVVDVEFVQGMIPHHEQAIEMAEIALDPKAGASAAVLALAERIRAGQDPEIDLMRGWLKAWGQPEMQDMPGHDMSSMGGMMKPEDMDRLSATTGKAFDAMWLEMMIAHHEGAIEMANIAQGGGKSAEVRALLEAVIAAQTAEIAEMKALLAG